MDLPLFPLHTVLCPGIALPLHVFEARYRSMVGRCLEEGYPFGITWIRAGREVGGGDLAIAAIGTMVDIREVRPYEDGRYDLVVVGSRRFRIEAVDAEAAPYLVGRVEPLADVVEDETAAAVLARRVARALVRYVDSIRRLTGDDEDRSSAAPPAGHEPADEDVDVGPRGPGTAGATPLAIPTDPTLLSYLVSGIVELDPRQRQTLLERTTTDERLTDLVEVLERETAYLGRRLRLFAPDLRAGWAGRN